MFKAPSMGLRGVVSSEHPHSSLIGLMVLKKGGNAVDAAVAVSLSLSVTLPHLSGLGGDLFTLIYSREEDRVYCVNGSGWTPRRMSVEVVREAGLNEIPARSPYSVTVPGMLRGLELMHSRFGSMDFKELIKPSIELAKGFPISFELHRAIKSNINLIKSSNYASKIFLRNGEALRPGELLVQEDLAKVLNSVMEGGVNVFYDGWVSSKLVNYLNDLGCVFEQEDFSKFRAELTNPLKIEYRGYEVYEIPPNSQGIITLMMLNYLNELELEKIDRLSPKRIHLMVEGMKILFTMRNRYVGDPKFMDVPINALLSRKLASKLKSIISGTASSGVEFKKPDTTNFVVIDSDGNLVSAIQSIYFQFGSGIMVEGTGLILNCRATQFNLSGVNRVEGWKRPLHTLSSLILMNDEEVIGLGTSGGEYRPMIHSIIVSNYVDYGLNMQDAIEAPRFVWNGGKEVLIEKGFIGLSELRAFGHLVNEVNYPFRLGVSHACLKRGKSLIGFADIRGEGYPLSY